jgi:EAL domain-containing protein (putative c-di-GMP-specific phosphodiesterase class I)
MLETSSQSPQAGRLLRHLPFRYVKLPVQLIDAAPGNRFRMAVLKAQLRLARQVGAEVVCGGIDSPALMQRCRSLGVDIAFGRSCGRTLPFASAVFDHQPGSSH